MERTNQMLTTEETKAVLVAAWNEVNALPAYQFRLKAIEKIVATHFNRAVIAKQGEWEHPYPIKAQCAAE